MQDVDIIGWNAGYWFNASQTRPLAILQWKRHSGYVKDWKTWPIPRFYYGQIAAECKCCLLINQSIRCELFQRTVRWNQNFGQCPNDHHTRSDWFWCIFKACWQDVLITRFLRTQQSSKTGIWCICSLDINKSCSLRIDCPKYTSNDGAVNMHWENSSIDYGKKRQKATSHRELGILYTLLKIFFHLQKCAFNSNERNRSPMVE